MSAYISKRIHQGLLIPALMLLLVLCSSFQADAQSKRRSHQSFSQSVEFNPDSVQISDSLKAVRDSIHRADSLYSVDSTALMKETSLDRPAFSTAKDSTVQLFSDGQRKVFYYGDASVAYGDMTLKADYIEYDMATGTVYARGTLDSLSGEWTGRPVMEQGGSTYEMEEVWYNFNTRKAHIYNVVTQQDDGLLHGKEINMAPDRSINIKNGSYTVCDAEDPHYYLHLTVAKVITEPSQKTVFGPAWAVVEDVPMFPIVIPYGFIPKRPSRSTGMLTPTMGEESSRGMYLRDGGMYFVFGDVLDLSVTGDIYSLGSWAIDINSRYKFNYKCNGTFSFSYSMDQTGEKGSTDFFQTKNLSITWSHSQDSKKRPGTSFSASVNFSSPSYNTYNATSVTQALQNQASSSISYSKNWNSKFNLSVNMLHSQNSRDSSYAFTLPNLTFSVTRFYPFKQKNRVGKEKFYEKFSLSYSTTLQNKISFTSSEFGEPGFWDKMQNGMTHSFSIGLPSFTLANYFTFSPSISYGQNWFFRKTEYEYDAESDSLVENDSGLLGAFGITQTYSGSMSVSTRLYGMYNFGTAHKIQAIRHVVTPSVSFSVSPEKGTYANGWRTLKYTDADGEDQTYSYNVYSGQIYSPPSKGKSASMSLSISNNVEAKVRDLRDTTGTGVKKVKIIDQLTISTGYNFLADSLNMSTIGVSMSTSLFNKISISGSATLDPYAVSEKGTKINKFNVQKEGWGKPVRITSASMSASYSISGKGAMNGNDGTKSAEGGGGGGTTSSTEYYKRIYYHPVTGEFIPGGWLYYTNPNVPWSMNFSYSFSYRRSYSYTNSTLIQKNTFTQTLSLSGNIKLTPKMALSATSGFDIMAVKMTTTQISATYDLHCFNIAVSWVPSGTWQSWSFRIQANASALADMLRFKKSTSYWDN